MMRGRRQHGRRPRRLQRANKAAALGPDQPGAERRDQGVACDLDRLFRPAHGPGGGIQQPGANRDDRHRDQRLHQRGGERQHDAAPHGLLVGDQIGRDHRLAVAGSGGMKDAVSKGDREQGPDRRAVGLRGADGRGHLAVKFRLFCQQPSEDAAYLRLGCRQAAARRTDFGPSGADGAVERQNNENGGGADRQRAREPGGSRPHGHCTVILLANIIP